MLQKWIDEILGAETVEPVGEIAIADVKRRTKMSIAGNERFFIMLSN